MRILSSAAAVAALTIALAPAAAAQGHDAHADSALVDPNSATTEQLAALPGMTAELARQVVQRRPFQTMLPLDTLLGATLSREQRTELYRHMFVRINLNTASREEIMLIPGVGRRMAYEFAEYRPYNDMARFRREIGKYVSQAEVVRLEKYVRL
jgi:DNA uptake protein ComE-like DNA-binding protein